MQFIFKKAGITVRDVSGGDVEPLLGLARLARPQTAAVDIVEGQARVDLALSAGQSLELLKQTKNFVNDVREASKAPGESGLAELRLVHGHETVEFVRKNFIDKQGRNAMPFLIGWRTEDYLHETSDRMVAIHWGRRHKIEPIFSDDNNTALDRRFQAKQ